MFRGREFESSTAKRSSLSKISGALRGRVNLDLQVGEGESLAGGKRKKKPRGFVIKERRCFTAGSKECQRQIGVQEKGETGLRARGPGKEVSKEALERAFERRRQLKCFSQRGKREGSRKGHPFFVARKKRENISGRQKRRPSTQEDVIMEKSLMGIMGKR